MKIRQKRNGVHLDTRKGLLLFFALLAFVQAEAKPNPFSQQGYLIDNVFPYEYSAEDFRRVTANPAVQDSFPVPGYDITTSKPTGDGNTQNFRVDGWRLGVAIASNVAIPSSNSGGSDGPKVFHTAQLSLSPPASLSSPQDTNSWSVCSAIWTLGLSQAALDTAPSSISGGPSSSCSGYLSSECISEMETGFNTAGFCQNQTMPRSCAAGFANGTDGVTRAVNLPRSKYPILHYLTYLPGYFPPPLFPLFVKPCGC